MSEWISVKERLPESNSRVLIKLHYKESFYAVAIFLDNLSTCEKDFRNLFIVELPPRVKLKREDHLSFYFEKPKVSFWMPFPVEPKEPDACEKLFDSILQEGIDKLNNSPLLREMEPPQC